MTNVGATFGVGPLSTEDVVDDTRGDHDTLSLLEARMMNASVTAVDLEKSCHM